MVKTVQVPSNLIPTRISQLQEDPAPSMQSWLVVNNAGVTYRVQAQYLLANAAVTSFSGGTTGLTPATATNGNVTLAGVLGVPNGGTGATNLTGLLKGNGTGAFSAATANVDYLTPVMTTLGDTVYGTAAGAQTRLPGNTTPVTLYLAQTGDGTNSSAPQWLPLSAAGSLTFFLSGVASDIGGYYAAPSPSAFTPGVLASVSQTVTTTPTLIVSFATPTGYPNVTSIPAGPINVHWETQKSAGSNNYYSFARIYKRSSGGVETLLFTTDNSSQTAVNTSVQVTASAFASAPTTLALTDRIVVKIYCVMVSSTATIAVNFDDNTGADFDFPSVVVDATNFLPYLGATRDVDLGSKSLTTTGTVTASKFVGVSGGSF